MNCNPRPSRWETAILATALALALLLRFRGLSWGLPDVYEEAIPLHRAWGMLGWAGSGHFDPNPHFFKYPSLVFYLQLLGQALLPGLMRLSGAVRSAPDFRALFLMDPTPFYLTGRALTAVFGAATLLPGWALARRAAGPRAAAVTALLLALHPALVSRSQIIQVDVPLTCFVAWALLLTVDLAERPRARAAIGAGLVAGLAASSKYTGLLLAVPLLLAVWMPASAAPGPAPGDGPTARPARGTAARQRAGRTARPPGRVALAALATLALGAAFLLTSPFVALDFGSFWSDFGAEWQHVTVGHFGLGGGPAAPAYARDWFTVVMGWPLGLASLAGLAWGVARRRRWAWILAAFFVPFAVLVGSWQMMADRYLLPLVHVGVIAGAALLEAAIAALPALRAPRRAALATAAGALVLAGPLAIALPVHSAARQVDTRALARGWIETHLPAGSLLVCEAYGPELVGPLDLVRLAETEPAVRAELRRRGYRPRAYAVLDLPVFQVRPERSARFYSPARCDLADAVVVTSSIRDRYRLDPARFAPQLAFYDSLAARWVKLAEFHPRGGPGPDIVVYGHPRRPVPFAARRDLGLPDTTLASGTPTGAEGAWYAQLGLDYETFGFLRPAVVSYVLALRCGREEPGNYVLAAGGLARCLWAQGHRETALQVLEETAARAPGPREAARIEETAAILRARLAAPAPLPGVNPPRRP